MTGIEIANFVMDYVTPVAVTIAYALAIYVFATVALTAHRRAKREREQKIH